MPSKSYRDLMVWQRAMDLALEVYRVTREFPREELYGLTSQVRRAVVSIPSNIAEGQGRQPKEFVQFLRVARGSLNEVETQIELAHRLGFVTQEQRENVLIRADEVGRLLRGLAKSLLE